MNKTPIRTNTRYRHVKERLLQDLLAIHAADGEEGLLTQTQLQERYGVSRPTISKALNELAAEGVIVRGTGRGSYIPAGSVPSGGHKGTSPSADVIGFVAPSFAIDISQQVCFGLSRMARRRGFQVIMAAGETMTEEKKAVLGLVAAGARGLVIYPFARADWDDAPEYLGKDDLGVPYVLVDTGVPDQGPVHVEFDNARAAYEMTCRLIANGHRRIATIINMEGYRHPGLNARSQGYSEALRDSGIPYDHSLIMTAPPHLNQSSTVDILNNLLTLPEPPTAIIAMHEAKAIEITEELIKRGIRVPETIVVAGFDLTIVSSHFQPAFPTTAPDFGKLGEVACQKLLESLDSGEPLRPAHYILSVPVEFREPSPPFDRSNGENQPDPAVLIPETVSA